MKILLVNPPRSPENNILKYAPVEARRFIHKKLIGPPLGLLTIAASVKDHEVIFFDCKGEYDLRPDALPLNLMIGELMEKHKPQVVGVTVITSEFDFALDIFRAAQEKDPEVITVAGGLHATLCPEDFTDPSVNLVVPGQNPMVFREIIDRIETNQSLEDLPGLWINSGGKLLKPLKNVPSWDGAGENFLMPDRSLLKRWISTYHVGGNPYPSTYVFTSLGCPYQCTFCSIWSQHQGKYHQRRIESLIEELKTLDDYPVVRFADANTLVNESFITELFDRIEEEGIKKDFIMDIRADFAVRRPDLIAKLARGGLKVVICGFESFRDEELRQYNKKSVASANQTAVKIFEQNGIMVRGNYVIPSGYGVDDFTALAEYADRNRVVYAGYTILTPMPGTLFYRQVKDQITDHDYRKYNFFNSVMKTRLDPVEFHERVGALWLIKKGTDVI